MSDLDYPVNDFDNHYYEAIDAFTRHLDPRLGRRIIQWAEIDGRKYHVIGGKVSHAVVNPTFDPIAKAGAMSEYFRGNASGRNPLEYLREREPIRSEYRDRETRIQVMDEQGLDKVWLYPTLGMIYEQLLKHDPEGVGIMFRAFNRWLEEDWGYDYEGRIFAAPYLALADLDVAVEELERALSLGARIVCMRPAAPTTIFGPLTPGDPYFDPFWARVNEAGITVAFHAGDAGYGFMLEQWGADPEFQAFRIPPLFQLLAMSPIADTVASMIADGVLTKHPNIRVATIENGAEWVAPLFGRLKKSWKMRGPQWPEDPRETFRRQVWVSPFYEDDLELLASVIGVDRILFGSDWPHAEGLADPLSYIEDLDDAGFTQADVDKIMYANAASLVQPAA